VHLGWNWPAELENRGVPGQWHPWWLAAVARPLWLASDEGGGGRRSRARQWRGASIFGVGKEQELTGDGLHCGALGHWGTGGVSSHKSSSRSARGSESSVARAGWSWRWTRGRSMVGGGSWRWGAHGGRKAVWATHVANGMGTPSARQPWCKGGEEVNDLALPD
jgi:hypothetical protein